MFNHSLAITLIIFCCGLGIAHSQTVTVTISDDIVDIDPQTGVIGDLPGPDGKVSFSEAMIVTNNTPGVQTIGFAIPQSDWKLQLLYPGRAVLITNTGFYFQAFDEVIIDGTTQTAFTGDTNPDGWEVVIHSAELFLNADNCALLGFDSTRVTVTESNGLIQGNTGNMNITLFNGSGAYVQGNTGETIIIDRSDHNIVVNNVVQRVRVLGFDANQPAINNRIGGFSPKDRNTITGYGTWNSEGLPSGAAIEIKDTIGTRVEHNWIGVSPDGLAQGHLATTRGISLEGENFVTSIRHNLIAGILGHGKAPNHGGQYYGWAILLGGTGVDVAVMNNTVGLDANGQPLLGSVFGIDIGNTLSSSINSILIGGKNSGEGNVIAGHMFNGITVGPDIEHALLSGNAIYSNGGLGIDLIPTGFGYGVTPNDPLDGDIGGNGLQNFPELKFAIRKGDSIRIIGTLNSLPSSQFTLEFFASSECDPSGHGEGQEFLGFVKVNTDTIGNAKFDVELNKPMDKGRVISATASLNPHGATSEYSKCITPWTDEGAALWGTFGDPLLLGAGSLKANEPATIHLTNARKNAIAFLIVGLKAVNLPFYGGTLVPAFAPPFGHILALSTNNNGEILITGVWPPGMTPGSSIYFQYWIVDPAGPFRFAASNALSGMTP